MRTGKLFTLIFLFISSLHLHAQEKQVVDSLRKLLYTAMPDTARVQLMLEGFAMQYYMSDPVRAINYCEQALELSRKINYEEGIGSSLGWLAYLYEQQGQIKKAIEYNEQALALLRKQGNKKQEGTVLNNLAAIYKDRGNIPEAIRYNNESLKIKIALHDSEGIATTYNNLGIIHSNQGNIRQSLEYYFKALKINESMKNTEGISTAWHNIGLIYKDQNDLVEAKKAFDNAFELRKRTNDRYGLAYSYNAYGGIYELQDSLDKAIEYYERALKLRTEIEDKQGMAYSLKNIGAIHEKRNMPDAADFYLKSLELFREMDDKWGMTTVMIRLGNNNYESGNKSSARKYGESALKLARELGYPPEIRDASLLMKKLYAESGQWKQVTEMSELYYSMRDSVQNIENRKDSFKQQLRYDYEKREASLLAKQQLEMAISAVEVKRQKTQKYFYIGGLALIICFTIVVWQRFRITRQQKQIIENTLQQLQDTQAQLIESEKMAAFGKLATRMAHEIQNPLNFVNNLSEICSELLEEDQAAADNASQEATRKTLNECLQKIKLHGQRAESIVRKLQEHINAGTAHEFFEKDS